MNEQLIRHFYESFQRKDYRDMAACYHPDATFRDEAFGLKNGKEIAAMWHMLCEAGKDLRVEFSSVQANENSGRAHWEAWYTFSRTGRRVHNVIEARFEFLEGKIIRHEDSFSFWRWSRQSLGATGLLLGWSGFLKNKVRSTAMSGLWKFIEKHPEYQ
ncbi:MAG: nuclear transport factor 2 family protein [Saprospiraceae bacterium]|nr:nuclear transport factor 2 family protein [Saprospiraceae bacterium]